MNITIFRETLNRTLESTKITHRLVSFPDKSLSIRIRLLTSWLRSMVLVRVLSIINWCQAQLARTLTLKKLSIRANLRHRSIIQISYLNLQIMNNSKQYNKGNSLSISNWILFRENLALEINAIRSWLIKRWRNKWAILKISMWLISRWLSNQLRIKE